MTVAGLPAAAIAEKDVAIELNTELLKPLKDYYFKV
jgi:hypothetical protein